MTGIRFAKLCYLLIATLSFARGLQAAEASDALLLKMLGARDALSYRATVVYLQGNSLRTVRIEQDLAGRRMHALDGLQALSELPTVNSGWVSQSDPERLRVALLNSYQAEPGEPERIAERSARPVQFVPRDEWRYGYRVWLDEATGMPLRTELMAKQLVLERMLVTQIELNSGKPRSLPQTVGRPAFEIQQLPSGFVLVGLSRGETLIQQSYSDGLASVSVFIRPARGSAVGTGQRGAMALAAKRIGDNEFIALGDVPAPTLARFLTGIVPSAR